MQLVLNQWQKRINRSEDHLKSAFQFRNESTPVVIVDTNYWTFGDRLDEIPDDHYSNIPDDAYIPFLHPWFGTGVLASAFGISIICNPKAVPAKITRSGHQTKIKMYETHFYKTDWKELDRLVEAYKKQRKEENMDPTPRVYGRGTFF